MKLVIGYLYPSIMSQYGDTGNVLCLAQRCRWRGIDVEELALEMGQAVDPEGIDLFFMGGGADSHQRLIAQDLLEVKGDGLRRAVEAGAAALLICGGYQLFGRFYRPFRGDDLPGLGVLDAYTVHWAADRAGQRARGLRSWFDRLTMSGGSRPSSGSSTPLILSPSKDEPVGAHLDAPLLASSGPIRPTMRAGRIAEKDMAIRGIATAGRERMVGNVIVQWGPHTLVGFENHGGRTYLGQGGAAGPGGLGKEGVKPLGKVLLGRGNNGRDGYEGAAYKNVIGTYLHGPLLPKNPHLADHLIAAALRRRHGPVELAPLDDSLELETHAGAVKRAREARPEAIARTRGRK